MPPSPQQEGIDPNTGHQGLQQHRLTRCLTAPICLTELAGAPRPKAGAATPWGVGGSRERQLTGVLRGRAAEAQVPLGTHAPAPVALQARARGSKGAPEGQNPHGDGFCLALAWG